MQWRLEPGATAGMGMGTGREFGSAPVSATASASSSASASVRLSLMEHEGCGVRGGHSEFLGASMTSGFRVPDAQADAHEGRVSGSSSGAASLAGEQPGAARAGRPLGFSASYSSILHASPSVPPPSVAATATAGRGSGGGGAVRGAASLPSESRARAVVPAAHQRGNPGDGQSSGSAPSGVRSTGGSSPAGRRMAAGGPGSSPGSGGMGSGPTGSRGVDARLSLFVGSSTDGAQCACAMVLLCQVRGRMGRAVGGTSTHKLLTNESLASIDMQPGGSTTGCITVEP